MIKLTKTETTEIFPKLTIKKGAEKTKAETEAETDSATKILNLEYILKLITSQLYSLFENKIIPKQDEKDKTKESPKTAVGDRNKRKDIKQIK